MASRRALQSTLIYFAVVAAAACDPPRGEVRPWRASDHDQPDRPRSQEAAPTATPDTADGLAATVWKRACAACHGPNGRGDGPQGPMVQAPDLTRKEWLATVRDDQIAEVIRLGRGRMPAQPDLPASVVDGLVRRIRLQGSP